MDKHYDDLLVELECPICTMYMTPPIRQCATGHSFCNSCQSKLPVCPLCQERFTETKNLTLESLARKMHYPCINSKFGCPDRVSLDEREEHEKKCTFVFFTCGYFKCKWVGKYEDIVNHWNEKKLSSRPYRATNVCHVKIQKPEAFYTNLIMAYNALFWYKFKITGGKLSWCIQYIGPVDNAASYYYEIELFKPGHPVKRTLLSDYCQSVDIPNDSVFKLGNSVMVSVDAINHYFGEDGLLIYYMRVKECKTSQEASSSKKVPQARSLSRDSSCSRESLTFLGEPIKELHNNPHKFNKARGTAYKKPFKKQQNKEPEK